MRKHRPPAFNPLGTCHSFAVPAIVGAIAVVMVCALVLASGQPDSRTPPRRPTSRAAVTTRPALSSVQSAELRGQMRSALSAGQLDRAEKLLAAAERVHEPGERAAWSILRAELEFARRRFAKAALAGMEVAILRPASLHAVAGLYWAGRSYEELGRPAKAAELYRECVGSKRGTEAVRREARLRLDAMKAKGVER